MGITSPRRVLICSTCSSLMLGTPVEARFLQVDPVGYKDQYNLYAYVDDDPINMSDPSGRESCPHSPCPDIQRAPPSVQDATVAALRQTSISVGSHEVPVQVMVEKEERTQVAEVRTGAAAGQPDRDNPMRIVMNRIQPSDRYALGADGHPHPRQTNPDERNINIRVANQAVDRRNLYPSSGDYRHMNQTNAPMFNRNTAGAITETYRIGSIDHTVVIAPGSGPLGPIPSDLHDVVVDPR